MPAGLRPSLGDGTAPIYLAHDGGLEIHVWVDETPPRNQGASLTAWELSQHGVAHTVIPAYGKRRFNLPNQALGECEQTGNRSWGPGQWLLTFTTIERR